MLPFRHFTHCQVYCSRKPTRATVGVVILKGFLSSPISATEYTGFTEVFSGTITDYEEIAGLFTSTQYSGY